MMDVKTDPASLRELERQLQDVIYGFRFKQDGCVGKAAAILRALAAEKDAPAHLTGHAPYTPVKVGSGTTPLEPTEDLVERMTRASQPDWWRDELAWCELIKTVLAAIRPGDRLPGGRVVVPEEPTEEMVDAGAKYAGYEATVPAYHAMLAALKKGERT